MEEIQPNVPQSPNTSSIIVKKVYESAKQSPFQTAQFKNNHNLSFSSTDIYQDKKFKPILIHKRRISNSSTFKLHSHQNSSTDNQDDSLTIPRAIFKKVQNSHIIKQFDVLYTFFQFQAQFKLLFRASDHHFSVQKFHQLCDYQTNTLTICKTKSNQIIGGYTPLDWAQDFQQNKTYFKTDRQNQTFLFSLTKNQKYPLAKAKKNKAICCFRNFGPTFGGGYDLQIGNRADQSYSSVSFFPRSFACDAKMVTQKHLTGSKNKQFKILEWQVYKVIKKKNIKPIEVQPIIFQKQQGILKALKKGLVGLFFHQKNQTG